MENLPRRLFEETTAPITLTRRSHRFLLTVDVLIQELHDDDPHTYERALRFLFQDRNICENLGARLWNSIGTMSILLLKITDFYSSLSNRDISERDSTRVCHALGLFQCVASHPETRRPFMTALFQQYVYPFLSTSFRERAHEDLRLTSLGVIAALVKVAEDEVNSVLLNDGIIPHCLHCMDVGNNLTKTVATFILHKIIVTEEGLLFCCNERDRFYAIHHALQSMTINFLERPTYRLLKYVVISYLRLSENPWACIEFRRLLPQFQNNAFIVDLLRRHQFLMNTFNQFLQRIQIE